MYRLSLDVNGLLAQHIYNDASWAFVAGNWDLGGETVALDGSGRLQFPYGSGVARFGRLTTISDQTEICVAALTRVFSFGGTTWLGSGVVASASQTGIVGRGSVAAAQIRIDEDDSGTISNLVLGSSVSHSAGSFHWMITHADDSTAAFRDHTNSLVISGSQIAGSRSGKPGVWRQTTTSGNLIWTEQFYAMKGRYAVFSGLVQNMVVACYGSTGTLIESQTADAGGIAAFDMLGANLLFTNVRWIVVYDTDGTTPLAVKEYATTGANRRGLIGGDEWSLSSGASAAATITNPGGEVGDNTGWTSGGGSFVPSVSTVSARTGTYSWRLHSTLTQTNYRYQDVSVPAQSESKIDAGAAYASLLYWQNGLAGQNDGGWIDLEFYSGAMSLLGASSFTVNRALQGSGTTYRPRGESTLIPANTRTVRLYLRGNQNSGTDPDAYIDDITLEISTGGPNSPSIASYDPDAFFVDLTGSTYSHPESLAHQASQWQVDIDSGFGSPDYDATDTYPEGGAPAIPTHTGTGLLASQAYYARVRYQDENGDWSSWSTGQSFTTDSGTAPTTPTIDSATPGVDIVSLASSAFADPEDPDRAHTMSSWQVDESGGDFSTPVSESLEDLTNLVSIVLGGLTASSNYIARVRHRAEDGSWSAWSSSFAFSTTADPSSKPSTPTLSLVSKTSRTANFSGSAYVYPGETYLHAETRLEVSTNNTFPVASTSVFTETPGVTLISADSLTPATAYYARIRYKANNGVWSSWSNTVSFTTSTDLLGGTILRLTAPRHGAVVRGSAVPIDANVQSVGGATFEIQHSTDYGETWSALASPSTLPYSWNTTSETDGPQHVIRGRWTDGVDPTAWQYRAVVVDNGLDPRVFNTNSDDGLDSGDWVPGWNTSGHTWTVGSSLVGVGSRLSLNGWAFDAFTPPLEPRDLDMIVEVVNASTGGSFPWSWFPEQCSAGVGLMATDDGGGLDADKGIWATFYALPIYPVGDCYKSGSGDGYLEVRYKAGPTLSQQKTYVIPLGTIHFVKTFGGCSKIPRYGVRLRVTTIRENANGTRDLRIQATVYGMGIDNEGGAWLHQSVVTDSTLDCGSCGVVEQEITTSKAYRSYSNLTVYSYAYGACGAPEGFTEPVSVETCPPPIFDLTIFGDDDLTPIWGTADAEGNVVTPSFSTWAADPRPYLEVWNRGPEHELDPIQGTSSIGAVRVGVLDKRTDPCDQRSGILTSAIGDGEGFSAYNGRRAVLRERLSDGTYQIVLDGPIYSTTLRPSLVMFDFEVKGPRERERNVALFTKNETVSVFPKGPVDGYGYIGTVFGSLGLYLIPPADIGTGIFHDSLIGLDYVEVPGYTVEDYTPEMIEIGRAQSVIEGSWSQLYTNVTVRWRYPGDTDDDWRYLRDLFAGTGFSNFFLAPDSGGFGFPANYSFRFSMPIPLFAESPTDGATIQFQVLADIVSETWPFYWEGPAGTLLREIYDGDYSPTDPNIRYDETAMAGFEANAPHLRLRKTEPEPNLREWVEQNIYAPLGWAPGLTDAGLIAPIDTKIPDNTGGLTTLDNVLVIEASWTHDAGRAVPVVRFAYLREWRDVVGTGDDGSDIYDLVSETVWIEYLARSNALLTAKAVVFQPETIRTIGGNIGETLTGGDLLQEWPARLALDRAIDITRRYAFGPELIRCRTIDTASVRALTVGSWAIIDLDWIPNLQTLYRGGQLLVEVVSRKKDPGLGWEFTLLVGGAGAVGLSTPTLDTPTVNSDFSVTVDIGVEWFGWSSGFDSGFGDASVTVRIEYAVSDTEPSASSGLWTLLGFVTGPGSITSEPLPTGTTVWVRARVERAGYRPSPWSTSVSAAIGTTTAALYELRVAIAQDGTPTVLWRENVPTLGLLIEFGIATSGSAPTYDQSVELNAKLPSVSGFDSGFDAGFRNISAVLRWKALIGYTVEQGEQISLRATPYTGFSGGAVTGVAGATKYVTTSNTEATVGSGFASGFDTGFGS